MGRGPFYDQRGQHDLNKPLPLQRVRPKTLTWALSVLRWCGPSVCSAEGRVSAVGAPLAGGLSAAKQTTLLTQQDGCRSQTQPLFV